MLVLVHGLSSSLRAWDLVVPILSAVYRIMRPDLLGFGESPQAVHGYSIEEQAAALGRALSAHEASGATLVGHSMGGTVSVAALEQNAKFARSLVLINSPP